MVGGKLLKGVTWLAMARLMLNALNSAAIFVLARLLVPADFGLVAIATSIMTVATAITDLSLGSALVQRKDVSDADFHSVFTIGAARSALIFMGIAIAAIPLASIYNEPRLVPVLFVTAAVSALPGLASPRMALLQRDLVFWQEFAVQTTRSLLVFTVSVGCALVFRSYWALVAGNLAGAVGTLILSYVIAPYRPSFTLSKARELFGFSVWLSLGNAVNALNWRMDQLALGYLVGKAPLGLYTVADNISALPVRETTVPITKALFPAFARIAHDRERLRQAYRRSQATMCAVGLPAGFGFAAIAAPAVELLLGQRWSGMVPIVQILSVTFALQLLASGVQPLAMSLGATKQLFRRDVRNLLIRVPFIVAGYWWGGLIGVVIGRAAASAIGTVWNMTLVSSLSGLSVGAQVRLSLRALLASAAMASAVLAVIASISAVGPSARLLELVSGIVTGALVYPAISLLLWLARGKPAGPEGELLAVARRLYTARIVGRTRDGAVR